MIIWLNYNFSVKIIPKFKHCQEYKIKTNVLAEDEVSTNFSAWQEAH